MANENLNSQSAICIIGANGGIGYALLQELSLAFEATFFPTYNSSPPSDTNFEWAYYNSLDPNSIESYFAKLENYKTKAIIDCSGAFFASSLLRAITSEIEYVISTNLTGPFITAKKALTALAPNGKLIFMSSILAEKDIFGSSIYAASKAGLEKGISVLGEEFRNRDLAICGIRLDYMDYGMTHKIKDSVRAEIRDLMPEREFIKIDVVTKIIRTILEDESPITSGRIFSLNEAL